jgi:hypothetical protein
VSIELHELVLNRGFNGRGRKIKNLSLWSALFLLESSSYLLLPGIATSADAIDEELVALSFSLCCLSLFISSGNISQSEHYEHHQPLRAVV